MSTTPDEGVQPLSDSDIETTVTTDTTDGDGTDGGDADGTDA